MESHSNAARWSTLKSQGILFDEPVTPERHDQASPWRLKHYGRSGMEFNNPERAGFTLLEVIVATLMTLVVVGTATRVILRMQDSLIDATVRATTLESSRRLLDRLIEELRDAQPESLVLTPPTDARIINFSTVAGWDGSERLISPDHTISFEAGTVYFDGTAIAALVDDLYFNLDDSLLTIVVRVERTTHVFGEPSTISRELSAQLSL